LFVEIIKNKSDTLPKFKSVLTEIENVSEIRLKSFQSDNGGEYDSIEFSEFLESRGIYRRSSVPYTAQQMGVAERMNQDLLSKARCMLIQAGLGPEFWGEAVNLACYVRNRCVSSVTAKTPYELWFGEEIKDVELLRMKVFGCKAWAAVLPKPQSKLVQRARKCVMLVYSSNKRAYRLWDIDNKYVIESRDVKFNEKCFPLNTVHAETSECCKSDLNVNVSPELVLEDSSDHDLCDNDSDKEETENVEVIPNVNATSDTSSRPKRVPKPKRCICCNNVKCSVLEPKSVDEALNREFCDEWKQAIIEEILCLESNGTWELVKRPPNAKVTKTIWVLRVKKDQYGFVEKFKARLVVQGCNQIEGVDYTDSYSPVLKKTTIRLMTAISVQQNLTCRQLDVKSAYLHSDIEEDIYIEQPLDFVDKCRPDYVCKLRKVCTDCLNQVEIGTNLLMRN